jgi:hypothetical protein
MRAPASARDLRTADYIAQPKKAAIDSIQTSATDGAMTGSAASKKHPIFEQFSPANIFTLHWRNDGRWGGPPIKAGLAHRRRVQSCSANYRDCGKTAGGIVPANGVVVGHIVPQGTAPGAEGFGYTSCALKSVEEEGPNPPGG